MSQMPQTSVKRQVFLRTKVLLVRKVISLAKRHNPYSENWLNHSCEIQCEQEILVKCSSQLLGRKSFADYFQLLDDLIETRANSDSILDHTHCVTFTASKHKEIKDPVCIKTCNHKSSGTYFSQMVLTSFEYLTIHILQ